MRYPPAPAGSGATTDQEVQRLEHAKPEAVHSGSEQQQGGDTATNATAKAVTVQHATEDDATAPEESVQVPAHPARRVGSFACQAILPA